jgi:hypothetical protein
MEAVMRNITVEVEVLDFGIDHSQYFPGIGTAYSSFSSADYGVGDNYAEALEDVLETISQREDSDVSRKIVEAVYEYLGKTEAEVKELTSPSVAEELRFQSRVTDLDGNEDQEATEEAFERMSENCELYYHVGIRYTVTDLDEEPTEPEEGDLVTEDHRKFYEHEGTKRKPVLELDEDEDWKEAVKAYMEREQFWPNCWLRSDHGNYHLLSLQ